MFTGTRSRDGNHRMRVIGGADDHRVDVLVLYHLTEVVIHGDAIERLAILFCVVFIHKDLTFFGALRIKITHGYDLRIGTVPYSRKVMDAGNTSCADSTYIDPVSRRILAEHGVGHDRW